MTGPDRSAADLLRTAAGLISERGHAKHSLLEPDGAMCALGAMNVAAGAVNEWGELSWERPYPVGRFQAGEALRSYVAAEFGRDIVVWNNAPGTSGEDVILAMKTVAEQLDDRS